MGKGRRHQKQPTPDQAEGALRRLVLGSESGGPSVASAYAHGYATLALSQRGDDRPEWYHDVDPLDLVFLGTLFPHVPTDPHLFGNARTEWVSRLRGSVIWRDIRTLVVETVKLSDETGLDILDGRLLLELCPRLETVLSKRKIPPALLPAALSDSRFAQGTPEGFTHPEPTDEARAAAVSLLHDHAVDAADPESCAGLLADALALFDHVGLESGSGPGLLLVALYCGVVAGNSESDMSDLPVRAAAWANGLPQGSPLVPIVDTIGVAIAGNTDTTTTVARLFGYPAFRAPILPADRRWHSAPGTDFIPLAHEFGVRRVVTPDHQVILLAPEDASILREERRAFEEARGHPLAPEDHWHLDVDNDTWAKTMDTYLAAVNVHPAWREALVTRRAPFPDLTGRFHTASDERAMRAAVDDYLYRHPASDPPDTEAEIAKIAALRDTLRLLSMLRSAAKHADYARQCLDSLSNTPGRDDVLVETLQDRANDLFSSYMRHEPLRDIARHLVDQWQDPRLTAIRVPDVLALQSDEAHPDHDLPTLFALAVADLTHRSIDQPITAGPMTPIEHGSHLGRTP